jgi:hypothetical protein
MKKQPWRLITSEFIRINSIMKWKSFQGIICDGCTSYLNNNIFCRTKICFINEFFFYFWSAENFVTRWQSFSMSDLVCKNLCMNHWIRLTYDLNYLITLSMEQSPFCDAKFFSDCQEILCILWNPMLNYRIHNWLPT